MGMSDSATPHAYVDFDSQAAAFDATARLVRLGHRRIALINPPADLIYATQRQRGYSSALNAAGLLSDSALIFNGPTTASMGRKSFEALIQMTERPHGLYLRQRSHDIGCAVGCP